MRRTGAALLGALTLAGCGGSSSPTKTVTVQTTKVEVVQRGGKAPVSSGAFDPQAIYSRDAPGVVTIISIYGGTSLLGGRRGAEGSGVVLHGQGGVATNAHGVTPGGRPAAP